MCQCDKCTSSRILLCGLTQGWAPVRRRVLPPQHLWHFTVQRNGVLLQAGTA